MLRNSMASISASSASTFSQDNEKLDLESVSALAITINQRINALLANDKAWTSLKLKCTSKLNIQKQPTFEFSEYSIVSNLYWGIEAIDAALEAKGQEERASRLQNSEKMLQVPASLHEQGVTSGIPNEYLICCSYFYLSVVRKLQSDDWQAALHFLQALLVSPRLVHEEFAPEVCQSILHLYIRHKRQERPERMLSKSASVMDLDEDQANEMIGWMAKEYKAWLLYYQIMSNGEHGSKHSASRDIDIPDDKSKYIMKPISRSGSGHSQGADLRDCYAETIRSSSIRCLKDILTESESETPITIDSCNSSSTEETFPEENQRGPKISLKIRKKNADNQQAEVLDQNLPSPCSKLYPEITVCTPQDSTHVMQRKGRGLAVLDLLTRTLSNSFSDADVSVITPIDIKSHVPCLVEVVCTSNSYKDSITSIRLTPRAASLMIIEILVTSFDYTTNNLHLSTISSPRVLSGLLDIPGNNDLEEFMSLAAILVRCMRFDGHCRKFICEFAPIAEFISLLRSNQKRATSTALEFFHELLSMPRSSAIKLLHKIRKDGSINSMSALLLLIQNSQPEHRLLAASLLLQLEMLEEASSKFMYREEAVKALLESLICEENSAKQALSAFILSNIGGTYSWTGEPYTVAWLAKRAGLTSLNHKNMIKNYDFSNECLQDAGIDTWCSKLARRIMKFGTPVFHDLGKGLDSKSKRISRYCLTAIAWIGCEVAKSSDDLRFNACEILLSKIEQYMHPGFELEERLLACLCIYNYTLGRGMKKLIHLSEGVRESLRRLANVTWMAEELLRVADYFQPNKWRISCVHTQTLEVGHGNNGAVTALIYYKGQLCSGYEDGSIKVWDIKGQTATLIQDMKNHNKAVTCFGLLEQGNCLLSGSVDKTIKIWQMVQRNLECIEVIATKESILSVDTYGQLIFTISRSHKMKVFDASRNAKDIFKNKRVKTMRVVQGKVYAGCMDSSIQELAITNSREQEIRAPAKKWMMQNKPINTLTVYKDWLYGASVVVEGSTIKDWRRNIKPQVSVMSEKGANVLSMEVVEDFIYLNTAASRSSLQIWLRGTPHKVGRLSAGSKITSLLSANDMILCGTETGFVKGWIPL